MAEAMSESTNYTVNINDDIKKCIRINKECTEIGESISKLIVNKDLEDVFTIVDAAIEACISCGKNINEIKKLISELIVNKNLENVFTIINATVQACILQKKDINEIGESISELIVNKDLEYVFTIINATVQACILQKKDINGIGELISELIVNKNLEDVFTIVDATVQACISCGKNINEIKKLISELIVNKNLEDVFTIVDATIEACISCGKNTDEIKKLISELIVNKSLEDVFTIINATVQAYTVKEEKVEKVIDIFDYCKYILVKNDELKEKIKPIFSLILSKYLMDTIINGNERDKKTEDILLEEYKNLTNNKINSFDEIISADLLNLCNSYFRERFNTGGVEGGYMFEAFLKGICELIDEKGTTVGTLYGEVDLFKNFKFLDLQSKEDISSKEELFNTLGLGEKDFEKKDTINAEQNFTVVYCDYLNHAFIMIIDRTKTWEEAIRSNTDSIKLIDSTKYVLEAEAKQSMSKQIRNSIFNEHCKYLNTLRYQENGTCWINATSAFFTLLQKEKEEKQKQSKEKCFTMEDIIREFKPNKKDALSPLEEDIMLYSTEKYFPLTKCFEKKDLTKEIIQDDLITKCHYLKQAIDKYKADAKKLEHINKQLDLLEKLKSIITVLEQPEMDIQPVALAPSVFDRKIS